MKKLLFILLFCPLLAFAEEGGSYDAAPDLANDQVALQHGAKLFINYCLNCHSAASMRYNRLRDLGLQGLRHLDRLLDGIGRLDALDDQGADRDGVVAGRRDCLRRRGC